MRSILLAILLAGCSAAVRAQQAPVRMTGAGTETWVLLSGLVGSLAGYEALEAALLQRRVRVVVVDPYRLSLDSADVSFAALARRVDALLRGLGVSHAHLVGHAHGGGVALRVASSYPERVDALYLLDAGALAASQTHVLGLALRLAPLIARLPGGRDFLRRRMVNGIRDNAGRCDWFDRTAQDAYVDPTIAHIGSVVAMANRLSTSQEPESLSVVVSRLRAPVLSIVGAVPHPSGPAPEEFTALAPIGDRLRVVRLPGVGHFPHEEATAAVVALLLPRGAAR